MKIHRTSLNRLSPIIHSIVTLPSMLHELALTPFRIHRQQKDWASFLERFPDMKSYLGKEEKLEDELIEAYTDYTAHYSSPLITLSLNRATLLYSLVKTTKPNIIHDLGSGFSSYVCRKGAENNCEIISVDDSGIWIETTKAFLEHHGQSIKGLITYEEYSSLYIRSNEITFDLCILDIGNYNLRKSLLPHLLNAVKRNNAVLFVDDFHVPAYRAFIEKLCAERNVVVLSLRKVTRRRLSHAALIISSLDSRKTE